MPNDRTAAPPRPSPPAPERPVWRAPAFTAVALGAEVTAYAAARR
ncbi:pyrroloquinoline quinone precursor peptide PqqA [Streptomyces luteireticuli]|uniref:Coenzyme PQQ synthesis protein A n=1 Tax=Streptomyces luteireticuli TaxID=173858 RepID=A0ABN0YMA0_9ACTN